MKQAPPGRPARQHWRAPARRVAISLAVVVAAAAFLVLAVVSALQTEAGEAFVRREVLSAANGRLVGRLEIDRIHLTGFLRAELDGVRLFAPDDQTPVASAVRIAADVRLAALLARSVRLDELLLDEPQVELVHKGATTNLALALALRPTPVPAAPFPLRSWSVRAPVVRLRDGAFSVDGAQPIALDNLNVHAQVAGSLRNLTTSLAASAQFNEPVRRHATLDLRAHLDSGGIEVELLSIYSGATRAVLAGTASLDLSQATLLLQDVEATADEVNGFIPAAKLLTDLHLSGSVSLARRIASADLQIAAGAGHARLHASATLGPASLADLRRYGGQVDLSEVDLRTIRPDLPDLLLNAHLQVDGSGVPLEGTAHIALEAARSRYRKLAVDDLHLTARLAGRTATIDSLVAHAAGADLRIKGTAGERAADLTAAVDAPALARTGQLLTSGLGLAVPALGGAARINVHLSGAWLNPYVEVTATAPSLSYAGNRVDQLQARVELLAFRPALEGTFTLTAEGVQTAWRQGTALTVSGRLDDRRASMDARGTLGDTPVELVLRGERESQTPFLEKWVIGAFQAQALGLRVMQTGPSRIAFGEGRVRVSGLALTGDLGRVALDADEGTRGTLRAQLRVDGLHLQRLPPELLPPRLNVAGTVGLVADVQGTLLSPVARIALQLQDGQFRRLGHIGLQSEIRVEGQRVDGSVHLQAAGGQAALGVRAPLVSLAAAVGRSLPVSATVNAQHLSLAALAALSEHPPELAGELTGDLALNGSARAPVLETRWHVQNASISTVRGLETEVTVSYAQARWQAAVRVNRAGQLAATGTARMTLPAAELLPGGHLRLRERPMAATLNVEQLDLAWVRSIGFGPPDLRGQVVGRVAASGTLAVPHGRATFQGLHLGGWSYGNLDGIVDLDSDDRVTLAITTRLANDPFLDLTAEVRAGPSQLAGMTFDQRLATPVMLNAQLQPTALSLMFRSTAPAPGQPAPTEAPYRSHLQAMLFASGTAAHPEAHLHVETDEDTAATQPGGVFTADLDYRDAKAAFAALFHSRSAGDLTANAVLPGDLGASALRSAGVRALEVYDGPPSMRPSVWRAGLAEALARPAQIAVDASHFNVGLLNGLSDAFRNLGGFLDLHLRKSGPLAPLTQDGSLRTASALSGLTGTLALSEGKFAVVSNGSFSDVTVKASGTYPSLKVTELRGHAGSGWFSGTADLEHTAGERFKGSVYLDVNEVPVVQDFQTRGYLSLKLTASGTGEPGRIDIPEVTLAHGRLKIPEQLPRRVQPMAPRPDITVLRPLPAPKSAPKPPPTALTLAIDRIVIPDDFEVDAPLENQLTLGALLHFKLDPALAKGGADPFQLTGQVKVVRGQLTLLRRFDVDSGTVTFYPGQLDDPTLNIKAHYDGAGARVTVSITGTVQDPHKMFDSSPAMSENEILAFLATGQLDNRPQQTDPAALQSQLADAAISALGTAAIGVVTGAVQQLLPKAINPDVLAVETDVAHSGIGRVRAGKYYLKGRLYVGGNYNPSANPLLQENTYEGEAEYHINGSQYVRLLVGNQGHHQLDYLLERNFLTGEQKKNGVTQ